MVRLTLAAVAVGSNVDPVRHVLSALRRLEAATPILALSTFWWTRPIGRPEQDDYVNGIALVDVPGDPRAFQRLLRSIEEDEGRVRTDDAYAPRTLDLDLVVWGGGPLATGELVAPDPDILTRRFLALGLLQVWPAPILPGGMRLRDPGGMEMRPVPEVTLAAVRLGRVQPAEPPRPRPDA